ncbi:uncharacterized protein TNCV_4607241 [Trichonephila clavipes]|nr:uncharacterized protein TNCV_4607241 [Trichonephila clavipes]
MDFFWDHIRILVCEMPIPSIEDLIARISVTASGYVIRQESSRTTASWGRITVFSRNELLHRGSCSVVESDENSCRLFAGISSSEESSVNASLLSDEHQETQRNVSPSEQEEDERGPIPTSSIKDLLKKWADVRAMVLEGHRNQADVSRVGDLYNNNAINYFRKILKKREKQSTLGMFFNAP